MSYGVSHSPDTLTHSDSDRSSFFSLSDAELNKPSHNKIKGSDTVMTHPVEQSSPSIRMPKLLPPHLWNLPYITLSPELLEAATDIDAERVSRLFAESTNSKINPLSASPSSQARPHFPVQPIAPFDGRSVNLRSFCSQLVSRLQCEEQISEKEKVRFAYQCLGHGALSKMRSSFRCLEDPSIPAEINTLAEFIAALKQRCEDPSLRDQATTRVEGLYQNSLKFHDFITAFEDNMVDSIYSTVDKSHWKLMLERRLSPQLRSLILSTSDVPNEYHAFVAFLRKKDAGLQEIIASSGARVSRFTSPTSPLSSNLKWQQPVPRSEASILNGNLPVSQGGSAMDLDSISRQRNADGHLTQEAKNARVKLGRCVWCNKFGHIVKFCPLGSRTSSLAAVRVESVEEEEKLKE